MVERETQEKLFSLKEYLKELRSVAVAFSGGVDSTFLVDVAKEVLQEKMIAVTVSSVLLSKREEMESEAFCKEKNIRQEVISAHPLEIPGFDDNPENRCYICKKNIFSNIKSWAKNNGFSYICDGTNVDDTKVYRPGICALEELEIKSPLLEAGLNKNDIRILSKERGLQTWNKPSFSCFATRFPYGDKLTEEKILRVEKAEDFMAALKFSQFRVRAHGDVARIEVFPEDFCELIKTKEKITEKFKEYGFSYVTLDLEGFRSGSMDEGKK